MSEQVQSPTAFSGLSASASALACTPRHVATKRKLSPPGGGFGGEGGEGGGEGGAGGAGGRSVPRVQLPCPGEHDGKRVHIDLLAVTPKFHVAHRVSFAHAAQQSADELPTKLPMDAPGAQQVPSVAFAELQLVALTLSARTGESAPTEALSSDLNCSHCAAVSSAPSSGARSSPEAMPVGWRSACWGDVRKPPARKGAAGEGWETGRGWCRLWCWPRGPAEIRTAPFVSHGPPSRYARPPTTAAELAAAHQSDFATRVEFSANDAFRTRCLLLFGHPCRLFLGPGFRLAARWGRPVGAVKSAKKRGKRGGRARYGLL